MKDFGGPAFPRPVSGIHGMMLWDFYAGVALAGLCANSKLAAAKEDSLADWASRTADAMLEQRNKREKTDERNPD